MEEEIDYLEDRNFYDAHVDLLMLYERKSDAAEVRLAEGRILEAIKLFLDDDVDRQGSIQRAANCILQGLRKVMPFGGSVIGPEITELLKRSDLLDPSVLSQDVRDEVRSVSFSCFHVFTPTIQDRLFQGLKLRL